MDFRTTTHPRALVVASQTVPWSIVVIGKLGSVTSVQSCTSHAVSPTTEFLAMAAAFLLWLLADDPDDIARTLGRSSTQRSTRKLFDSPINLTKIMLAKYKERVAFWDDTVSKESTEPLPVYSAM